MMRIGINRSRCSVVACIGVPPSLRKASRSRFAIAGGLAGAEIILPKLSSVSLRPLQEWVSARGSLGAVVCHSQSVSKPALRRMGGPEPTGGDFASTFSRSNVGVGCTSPTPEGTKLLEDMSHDTIRCEAVGGDVEIAVLAGMGQPPDLLGVLMWKPGQPLRRVQAS